MTQPVLELRGVTKTYGHGPGAVVALKDVTLTLAAGEVVALVGKSGSGKTTLLNVVAGWEMPETGDIRWRGAPLDSPRLDWALLGIVPQSLGLIGEFTLRENAEYPLRFARDEDRSPNIDELFRRLGIIEIADRYPHQASLGEQQRAAVARSLVLEPPLILLDEPTSHLDSERARDLFGELLAAGSRGTACLIATHARAVVEKADRVLSMDEGVMREGPPPPKAGP